MDNENNTPVKPEVTGTDTREERNQETKKRRRRRRGGAPRPAGQPGSPEGTGKADSRPVGKAEGVPAENPAQAVSKRKNPDNRERRKDEHGRDNRNAENRGGDARSGENRNRRDTTDGKKNRRPQHGYDRRGAERGLIDPYGDPDENAALAELRARIVIKAADGSVPASPSVQKPTQGRASGTGFQSGSAFTSLSAAPDTPVSSIPEEEKIPQERIDELLYAAPDTPTPLDDNTVRVEVVGIRFRSAGKMYYFDPCGLHAEKGSHAIVETARGPEYGDVCLGNTLVNEKDTVSPLRPVLRLATAEDDAHNEDNRQRERKALETCAAKIAEHGLEMKLIDAQYTFDNTKLLFYFTSDDRVDFRNLVKDLASIFRTRTELRQIGIRDEAKMLGGLGACGRPLCCTTFLPDFTQVSIKMAKEQNLSLNSAKISGVCGRLMCCLRFESEVYAEETRRTPPVDSMVRTPDGVGLVIGNNPIAGTVRVVIQEGQESSPRQYKREEVTVLPKEKRPCEPKGNAR